jgi:hypothetical protein
MRRDFRTLAAAVALTIGLATTGAALAQKPGGVLKVYFFDSPASMSIHEETTNAAEGPMMGVFNNLVLYEQDVPQSGLQSIVPDLASEWSWDEDKTQLTFRLREGVRWHDGKPFTAKDIQCTWDLLTGKTSDKLRINPRKAWYRNLNEVTTDGDFEVTFRLKRPQPAFIALLASGFSPVYPCHVSPRDMRSHPIGTGPFKFVEFNPKRVDQGGQKSLLLEKGPALSRRHRVYDHQERIDRSFDLPRRQGRFDFALLSAGSGGERHKKPGAGRDLQPGPGQRQSQRHDEPRGAAIQRLRSAACGCAELGSQSFCGHPDPRQGRFRRRHAAPA